jgi:hypothetical protein
VIDGMMGWIESERRWPLGYGVFKISTVVVRSRLAEAGARMPAESGTATVTVILVDARWRGMGSEWH